jgi:hypothetical protein
MKAIIIAGVLAGLGMCADATGEDAELSKVLIIGDSISIDYTKPLAEILKGKAIVVHNPGNAEHSGVGLKNIDGWLGGKKWDVIQFNYGLHDLKYVDQDGEDAKSNGSGQRQVPLEEYEKNMEAIVARLKKTQAKLIFATTTPIPPGVNPIRVPEDAVKYNAVALKIMKKYGIAVDDLYTFILPQCEKFQIPRNVHFTDEGSNVLAIEIAKHVLKALGKPTDGLDLK